MALKTSCMAGELPTIRGSVRAPEVASGIVEVSPLRLLSKARSISWRRGSSSIGLSRYSYAPRFMASTAVSMVEKAVMIMTGTRESIARISLKTSNPCASGSRTSSTTA